MLIGVAAPDLGDAVARRSEVALADVHQDEHRLLGEEPEAADRLGIVIREAEIADRPAALEALLQPREDDRLPLVRFTLRGRPVPAAALQALEAPLDQGKIGQDELEVEPFEIAGRIDAALGMRYRGVLERPDDVQQRIRFAHMDRNHCECKLFASK